MCKGQGASKQIPRPQELYRTPRLWNSWIRHCIHLIYKHIVVIPIMLHPNTYRLGLILYFLPFFWHFFLYELYILLLCPLGPKIGINLSHNRTLTLQSNITSFNLNTKHKSSFVFLISCFHFITRIYIVYICFSKTKFVYRCTKIVVVCIETMWYWYDFKSETWLTC